MSYKYVIGLDVSTHMGLAVVNGFSPAAAQDGSDPGTRGENPIAEGSTFQTRSKMLHTEEIEGTGTGMARALFMVQILHERLKLFGPPSDFGFAVVEQPAYAARGGAAHNVQNELNAIMRFSLHMKGIPAFTVAPNTIKKFATGNGRAEKPEMIAAARELGISRNLTDNEADALHLALFGWELVDPGFVQGVNARKLVKDWGRKPGNLKQLTEAGLFT